MSPKKSKHFKLLGKKRFRQVLIWTDNNVIILIELYKKYVAEFERGIKKHVWTKIGRILSEKIGIEVSGIQCDTKWKGLVKHYKLVKKHNDTSGNEPKYWKFYDILNDILHKKPEIEAVATCSSAKGLQRNEENDVAYGNDCASSSSGTSTPTPTNKRKRRTMENSAEKRHRERLQRQDRFLDILQDIANTMKNKNCGGPENE
ncbi:uncharacterized protein LOC116163820 [Photinus pyralis]|uniref:uncharacterized protein LOC116163820 n=1 Tax=Photinus pyralis TaxID=7054 RepID=UPI0012672C7D|nr:uncharacterized protein LOC116163820 [Photinus pyralis]